MKKTYTDRQVRSALKAAIEKSSYGRVAAAAGGDKGNLWRMVNANGALSPEVCALVGFEPVDEPRRWMRSTPKQPGV